MVITLTRSVLDPRQRELVDRFLREFLARLKRDQPGVLDGFHFDNDATGESTTLILWRDEEARRAYRDGELIKDAMAMEQKLGIASSRDAFPISISTKKVPAGEDARVGPS